jgi:hypothetical protein
MKFLNTCFYPNEIVIKAFWKKNDYPFVKWPGIGILKLLFFETQRYFLHLTKVYGSSKRCQVSEIACDHYFKCAILIT